MNNYHSFVVNYYPLRVANEAATQSSLRSQVSDGSGRGVAILVLCLTGFAMGAQEPVSLGIASSFAVLAGSGITIAGAVNSTAIMGDIGSYPTPTISGLGNVVLNGVNHAGDTVTQNAKTDLTAAYNDAASRAPAFTVGTELGGTTLTPGLYNSAAGTFGITGTLTLDAQGDVNAVFIFQAASTLITAGSSVVMLTGGAQACHVFWQVGSSATLGINSSFKGIILATTSATLTTGATVEGRVLAENGAVTLDGNNLDIPVCNGSPLDDTDGDGVNNPDESVCGTNPNDAASYLRIMDLQRSGSNDVDVTVYVGSNRTCRILGADSSSGAWPPLTTFTNTAEGTMVWTDHQVVTAATQRFYRVMASYGSSNFTNTVHADFAVFVPATLPTCAWSLIGVPVDLAPSGNTLNGELGRQLAVGLTAAMGLGDCFDRVYIPNPDGTWKECLLVILPNGSTNWWDMAADAPATVTITAAAAFWVKRCSPTAPPARTAWTGRSYTNAPMINLTNGWTLFSWPLATPGTHHNLGAATPSDQLGFLAAGATAGKSGTYGVADGDELWAWSGTRWSQFWLVGIGDTNYDGRWWDSARNQFGDFSLEAGKGYFYRHRGTNGFAWTPHEAPTP